MTKSKKTIILSDLKKAKYLLKELCESAINYDFVNVGQCEYDILSLLRDIKENIEVSKR